MNKKSFLKNLKLKSQEVCNFAQVSALAKDLQAHWFKQDLFVTQSPYNFSVPSQWSRIVVWLMDHTIWKATIFEWKREKNLRYLLILVSQGWQIDVNLRDM